MKAATTGSTTPSLPHSPPGPGKSTASDLNAAWSRRLRGSLKCVLPALVLFGVSGWMVLAQSGLGLPKGRFTNFVFPEYHEAPNERQLKSTLKGAEALPQEGGVLRIQGLRVDTFEVNGDPGFVLEADDCDYSSENAQAWSDGPIRLRTADDSFSLAGFGFRWQGAESVLTISNRVHTVLRGGLKPLPKP